MKCNIASCPNRRKHLKKWLTQLCDLHGLKFGTCVCKPPFKLFPFPTEIKDQEACKRWARIVDRKTKTGANWQPTSSSRICSRHFKDGEPTVAWPNPTEHLDVGYDRAPAKSRRGQPKKRLQKQRGQCKQKSEAVHTKSVEEPDCAPVENEEGSDMVKMELINSENGEEENRRESVTAKTTFLRDHDYTSKELSTTDNCQGYHVRDARMLEMEAHVKILKQKLGKEEIKSKFSESYNITDAVLKSDETVKEYTGIESKQKLESLHQIFEPRVQQERHRTDSGKESSPESTPRVKLDTNQPKTEPKRSLSTLQEFILVLVELRLALDLTFLAGLFGITPMSVSQIFHTWIKVMAVELSPMIIWPNRMSTGSSIPTFLYSKYKHLRCTIDCTEVLIERPEGKQKRTWSNYRKDHTVKILVAVAPNGMICFLSKSRVGSTSDIRMTTESGFYKLLESGDVVLANALGLGIEEDLLLKEVKLEIPPPRQEDSEQQNPGDDEETQEITNTRMYVERAVGRIKWFAILKERLPNSLVPLVDDIVTVCAALVNLCLPKVK